MFISSVHSSCSFVPVQAPANRTQDRDVSDNEDFHFLVLSVRGSRAVKPRRIMCRYRAAKKAVGGKKFEKHSSYLTTRNRTKDTLMSAIHYSQMLCQLSYGEAHCLGMLALEWLAPGGSLYWA